MKNVEDWGLLEKGLETLFLFWGGGGTFARKGKFLKGYFSERANITICGKTVEGRYLELYFCEQKKEESLATVSHGAAGTCTEDPLRKNRGEKVRAITFLGC